MTLAGFVHLTGLLFNRPLALKHFHDITPWKEKNMKPDQEWCETSYWRFVLRGEDVNRDAGHAREVVVR